MIIKEISMQKIKEVMLAWEDNSEPVIYMFKSKNGIWSSQMYDMERTDDLAKSICIHVPTKTGFMKFEKPKYIKKLDNQEELNESYWNIRHISF